MKKIKSITSQFFKIEITRLSPSSERLNNSPAQSAGGLWPNIVAPVGAEIVAHSGL